MRVRVAFAVAAAGLLAVTLIGVVGAGAQGGGQQASSKALFAVLTGAKEPGGGDPNGRGSFTAIVDGNRLCYGLTNKNIEDPGAAHIHRGRSGVAGDIVVPLQQPSSGDPGASSECIRVQRSVVQAILANPNRYYVNVHTAGLPDGAIRGQLFARQR
jgi:CHRD domain